MGMGVGVGVGVPPSTYCPGPPRQTVPILPNPPPSTSAIPCLFLLLDTSFDAGLYVSICPTQLTNSVLPATASGGHLGLGAFATFATPTYYSSLHPSFINHLLVSTLVSLSCPTLLAFERRENLHDNILHRQSTPKRTRLGQLTSCAAFPRRRLVASVVATHTSDQFYTDPDPSCLSRYPLPRNNI